jgi:hypothetical protein
MLCAGMGCASKPPADQPLPALREIRSQPPRGLEDVPPQASGPRAVVRVQVLDLPLRHSLDKAWSAVNEQVVPELARAVWNANGLRVGLLVPGKWNALMDELPPALSAHERQIATSGDPIAICRSPLLPGPLTVDRTIPPMAVREQQVRGGRMQLLARVIPRPGGATVLELAPHHFKPEPIARGKITRRADRVHFEPRTAQEKELDGTVFSDLALQFEMDSGRTLVIGLYWPWDQPGIENFADQLEGHVEADAAMARSIDRQPPPLPNHVGRVLLAARRPGGVVQKIMLLTLDRRPTPVPVSRAPRRGKQ